MAYAEPTVMTHIGHEPGPPGAWRVREFLRHKMFPVLLEWRGDLERHGAVVRGDPCDIGDALTTLRHALERGLAD